MDDYQNDIHDDYGLGCRCPWWVLLLVLVAAAALGEWGRGLW